MKAALTAAIALVVAMAFAIPNAGAQEGARIHLIHGIPDTDVDVEAGGENVLEGFSFGDIEDLSGFAGSTLTGLKVKAAGTDTVAIDAGDVELPASGNISVIAHLDGSGNPTLGIFENDTSTLEAGKGRLTVRHTAAAPAVDVKANGEVAFANLAPGAEASADLDAGTISAEVVPAGAAEPVVIGPADLAIEDGASLVVYAVGSLDGETLNVITESISGLGTAPNAVDTGNSPVDNGSMNVALAVVLGLLAASSVAAVRVARVRADR